MADDKHYVPGDFYRICDRTGFKVRASATRKQWDDLIVRDESYEPRQPQDYVTGVVDEQWVEDPRPVQSASFVGPLCTVTTANVVPGQVAVVVESTIRMLVGDRISLMQDNGVQLFSTIQSISDSTHLQIQNTVTFQASAGAEFNDLTAYASPNIG